MGNYSNKVPAVQQLLVFTFSLFITCYYLYWLSLLLWDDQNTPKNHRFRFQSISAVKRKVILMIPSWWGGHYPHLPESNRLCPKCFFTQDQNWLKDCDAMMFHGMNLPNQFPERASPHQIWVMMWFEAIRPNLYPHHRKLGETTSRFNGLINWTMSYRLDSDVPTPYGRFMNRRTGERGPIPFVSPSDYGSEEKSENASRSRSHVKFISEVVMMPSIENFSEKKIALWVVSNCQGSSNHRLELVTELQSYVPVDIMGQCGDNEHPCTQKNASINCKTQFKDQYLFYLSFENGNCQDYVTEKFFDVVNKTDMIPIVLGGGGDTYRKMFPPKSYIDLRDFKNAEDLADYLIDLSQNPEEWLSYFEWRKDFWVQTNRWVTGHCDLCDKLWELDKKNFSEAKSYEDIWEWISHEPDEATRNLMKEECDIDNVEIDQIWKIAEEDNVAEFTTVPSPSSISFVRFL